MEDSWKQGGLAFLGTFSDLLINEEANEEVADFVRGKIKDVVKDRETAEKLTPRGYPIFARRPCLDTEYYEAFNQPNVYLIDCIGNDVVRLSDNAVHTEHESVELDTLIVATGFDGMTGALLNFEVTGKNGLALAEKWESGSSSFLGMMMHGFPNMFLVCGPNGPAVLANIISLNEQNVDWICALMEHMADNGQDCFEVTQEAEDQWMDEVRSLAELTLVSKANTWYTGGNISGKPRGLTVYTGGFKRYRDSCDVVAANGYEPLVLD